MYKLHVIVAIAMASIAHAASAQDTGHEHQATLPSSPVASSAPVATVAHGSNRETSVARAEEKNRSIVAYARGF